MIKLFGESLFFMSVPSSSGRLLCKRFSGGNCCFNFESYVSYYFTVVLVLRHDYLMEHGHTCR